jgi:hypothetical protein
MNTNHSFVIRDFTTRQKGSRQNFQQMFMTRGKGRFASAVCAADEFLPPVARETADTQHTTEPWQLSFAPAARRGVH